MDTFGGLFAVPNNWRWNTAVFEPLSAGLLQAAAARHIASYSFWVSDPESNVVGCNGPFLMGVSWG